MRKQYDFSTAEKMKEIRAKLIESGVRSAHEFGYPHATVENLMTDTVYRMYFVSMLKQSLQDVRGPVAVAIQQLLDEAARVDELEHVS